VLDEEIQKILTNRDLAASTAKLSAWQEFKKPQLYKPLIIMILFFTIQQFSGIFTIFIYAAQFSMEAAVSIDEFLSAVIIGLIRCCTTVVVAFASDKYGRRPLAIFSSIGMCLCMLGIVVCSIFGTALRKSSVYWLPTAFLFLFIFCGTFGILTLPFAMLGEMYPQSARGHAVGLTIFYAYVMSFVNVKTFSSVFSLFGSVTIFSFYAIVALLGVVFSIFILPETKGKSLQEIENYFRK
jgi:MFS family permease